MLSAPDELVAPAYFSAPEYERTLGPEVADLAELASYAPDPEQRLILDSVFGTNGDTSAAFEFGIICARQNLKTAACKQIALGWLFLTKEDLIVWSAHEFSTAREAHRDMVELIEGCRWLERQVLKVYESNADRSIHLKSGARLDFKARTRTGSRGLSGKKVILDEGFALHAAHMGSLLPTLSAQPDPQVLYASSAGLATSTVLRALRDRGRAGRSPRLGYAEWCFPPGSACEMDACEHAVGTAGCMLDRPELLKAANPLLGRRRANGTGMTLEYLRAEREALSGSPEDIREFMRERCGLWEDPGAAEVFGAGRWELCEGAPPAGARLAAVSIAVSVDLGAVALVGAGWSGRRLFVQPLAYGAGPPEWVVEHIPGGVPVIVDPKGPAGSLIRDVKAAGHRVVAMRSTDGATDACDAFDSAMSLVKEGVLMHDADPALTQAVNGAAPRNVGDRRAWGRRSSRSEISALEAASNAAWWVSRPARDPLPPPAPRTVRVSSARHELATMAF